MDNELLNNEISDDELTDISGGYSRMFRPEAENSDIESKKILRNFECALENMDKMTAVLNLAEMKRMNCREYEECQKRYNSVFQGGSNTRNVNGIPGFTV